MLIPPPKIHGWQRVIQRITALRPVAEVLRQILPSVDRHTLRLTAGRYSLSYILAALPTIELTTTGAKSGLPRTIYLAAIISGEQIGLVGTALGSSHHPAWYYNLLAHPQVTVTFRGESGHYQAHLADGPEWEHFWQLALIVFPGFAAYRQRITARQIPIFVLTPIGDKKT